MPSGKSDSRRTYENGLSKLVDSIFDRYTVVPSSVADENEIDELQESFENLDTNQDDIETFRASNAGESDIEANVNARAMDTYSQLHTINPQEIQLNSSSNGAVPSTNIDKTGTGAVSRKTIPNTWQQSQNAPNPDISSPSPSLRTDELNIVARCTRCFENDLECKPSVSRRGLACQPCRQGQKKCSFVASNAKPKPGGARYLRTPSNASFDSFDSGKYAETDSNDESFELDSSRVTVQQIFGRITHLAKTHKTYEKRFDELEMQLKSIGAKQDQILKKLDSLS